MDLRSQLRSYAARWNFDHVLQSHISSRPFHRRLPLCSPDISSTCRVQRGYTAFSAHVFDLTRKRSRSKSIITPLCYSFDFSRASVPCTHFEERGRENLFSSSFFVLNAIRSLFTTNTNTSRYFVTLRSDQYQPPRFNQTGIRKLFNLRIRAFSPPNFVLQINYYHYQFATSHPSQNQ